MARTGYTLISCIGKGGVTKTDKGDYKKTEYFLESDSLGEYFLFTEALIDKYINELKKIILIGTEFSNWYALIPEYQDRNAEMFFKYCDLAESNQPISDEQLKELEAELTRYYSKDITLLKHDSDLDSIHLNNTLSIYSSIYSYVDKNTKLIIDITHGLRFMPLLVYQSLQFYGQEYDLNDVIIYYGELGKKESRIRDLSSAWRMAEINKAVYSFKHHYDGRILATYLYPYSKEFSNWIARFSHIIDSNLTMQILKLLEQLKGFLEKREIKVKTDSPQWVSDVIDELNSFYNAVRNEKYEYILYYFANELWKHGRKAQAIITLNCSVETKLVLLYGEPSDIGNYDVIEEIKRDKRLPGDFPSEYRRLLFSGQESLRQIRNQLAHSGGENYDVLPDIDSKKWEFEKFLKPVKCLLECSER